MAFSEFQILLRRSIHQRLSALEFRDVLRRYQMNHKVKSRDVVSSYINCCLNFCVEADPLLMGYLQELLFSGTASLIDFVTALILQWKTVQVSNDQQQILQKVISTQRYLVTDLNIILATNSDVQVYDSRSCVLLSAKWLEALAKWSSSDAAKDDLSANSLTQVVGYFLVSQLNSDTILRIPSIYNAVQSALDQCMGTFSVISMELMNKLSIIPKPSQKDSADVVDSQVMEMAALQFEEGVMHTQIIAARSATTALIQHTLSSSSTVEDAVIYTFLNTRHAGDHAMMFTDLVFATIDAMIKPPKNELYRDQCQIFVYNKLPSILSIIVTSSFETFSSEQILIDAWSYVNATDVDSTTTIRRFLQICAIFHLISSESAVAIAGEDTSLRGLYAKDELVSQVTANHIRGPRLIDELLKNDGNAGSISQAIVEIMHNYCHMRETQHLKDMANAIVKKPAAINAIGLFIRPALVLSPLCTLLDEWKWDDIHGESQPVYDEFGSVFLLIMAFKHRLDLGDFELGIQQSKGFLSRYLSDKNHEELKLSQTTEKHLGNWIKALYIDEGLSDELTGECSAQEFYMLVPTLLAQSCHAYSKGKLSHDLLKAGLEYLLEPFLLPSLVPAFGWIDRIIDTEPQTAELVTQILIKPPSGEARELHQTILSMASKSLNTDLSSSAIISDENEKPQPQQNTSLPQTQFALSVPEGDLTQIASEQYVSLQKFIHQSGGALNVIPMLVSLLLQSPDFHHHLDFIATIIVLNDWSLRSALQILHNTRLGPTYLKRGENLFAEAIVHLYRRVELYASTLSSSLTVAGGQNQNQNQQDANGLTSSNHLEPFVPLNVTNLNLVDIGINNVIPNLDGNGILVGDANTAGVTTTSTGTLPDGTFSTGAGANTSEMNSNQQTTAPDEIDLMLDDATAAGVMDMDGLENTNLDDMYGLQSGDFGLGMDELDLSMF